MPGGTPERLQFGLCPNCAYAAQGTPEICFACASEVVDQAQGPRCTTCDGALGDGERCRNWLCGWPVEHRGWEYVYSLAQRSGVLEEVINSYKYRPNAKGWAWIFARLLLGYLEEHFTPQDDHGVIVGMPTYVGAGGRDWDHIGLVLERAAIEDRRWPFAKGAIVKTGPTRTMVGLTLTERDQLARFEIAPLLRVPDPSIVAGRRVLVYDDVFTSGTTLREVARTLMAAGATGVDTVVLARQPFRR